MARTRDRMRELGWLATSAAIGVPAPALLALVAVALPASLAGGLGIVVFAAAAWACRRLAGIQRRRAAAVLDRPVPSPYLSLPSGSWARLRTVLGDPGTWRDLA